MTTASPNVIVLAGANGAGKTVAQVADRSIWEQIQQQYGDAT
jgi:hypothetical protein